MINILIFLQNAIKNIYTYTNFCLQVGKGLKIMTRQKTLSYTADRKNWYCTSVRNLAILSTTLKIFIPYCLEITLLEVSFFHYYYNY